jgi:hypothetical protein
MQFGKCKPNGKMAFVGHALKKELKMAKSEVNPYKKSLRGKAVGASPFLPILHLLLPPALL